MTEDIKSERSKIMGNQMGRSASSRKAGALKESKLKITQEYEAKIPSNYGEYRSKKIRWSCQSRKTLYCR